MAPSAFKDPHILLPSAAHTHTIIALHGRGSQGPEFADELFEEKTSSGLTLRDTFPGCKWVFPSSQTRYSTVFQDELDEWFDIYSLADPSKREELQIEGLPDSIEFIHGIISEEAKIVSPENIILLGLSQGSATGAYVGLNGWLPLKAQVEKYHGAADLAEFFKACLGITSLPAQTAEERESSVLDTPVFLGHTADDEVIDVELGRQTRDVLRALGMMKVVAHEDTDGGHLGLLKSAGLDRVVDFLREIGCCNPIKQ